MKRWAKPAPAAGGIDPGREGWLVLTRGRDIVTADPIPYRGNRIDRPKLRAILRRWKLANCTWINVEHQQPFGREGVSSVWTAAEAYGTVKSELDNAGFEGKFREVRPVDWKRDAGLVSAGGPKVAMPKKPKGDSATKKAVEKWKLACRVAREKQRVVRKVGQRALKDKAVELARRLAPRADFRASPKARVPHNGKCEAYILSVLAGQTLGVQAGLRGS